MKRGFYGNQKDRKYSDVGNCRRFCRVLRGFRRWSHIVDDISPSGGLYHSDNCGIWDYRFWRIFELCICQRMQAYRNGSFLLRFGQRL